MKRTKGLIAALCAILAAHTASAAEVYRLTLDGKKIVIVDGDIDSDTTAKVASALRQFGGVAGVVLNSHGGNVIASLDIASLIAHIPGSKTTVPPGAICASACVTVLLAGSTIQIAATSRVGVHQSINMVTGQRGLTNEPIAKLYYALDVPPSVVRKMWNTPSDQMSWLTLDELLAIPRVRLLSDNAASMPQLVAAAQHSAAPPAALPRVSAAPSYPAPAPYWEQPRRPIYVRP